MIDSDKNCKTAFCSVNSLSKIFINNKDKKDKLENSGVYQVNCSNCPACYVGQTGRAVSTRIKEHFASWVNQKGDLSNVALHLLENQHTFDKDRDVRVLHICEKGQKLDRLELLEINRLTKKIDRKYVMNKQLEHGAQSPLIYPL